MINHTPGPWFAHPTDAGKAIVAPDCSICEMSPWDDEYQDELEANARLIASAPDLLEALKRVLNMITNARPDVDVMIEARAAIAKATREAS